MPSGIGLEVAGLLRERGARVATLDRSPAPAGDGEHLQADVTNAEEVRAAVAEAERVLGEKIELAVNSAGVYRVAAFHEMSVDEWDEVFAINVRGTMLVSREVVARLGADARAGAIVNLASTGAFVSDASEPAGAYGASKGAIVALTRQMAAEWASAIRVNAVAPGIIATPMVDQLYEPGIRDRESEEGDRALKTIPLQRLGRADDVAEAIAFLLSDRASYVTGSTLVIDGGATLV